MTEHTPLQHELTIVNPTEANCRVCSICHCREHELPTECPGYELSIGVRMRIRAKDADFKNGIWQRGEGATPL